MNSDIVNWISIIGSFLSLIGVIIALVQISKTRRAAEAAKNASIQTQKAISRNLLISDISICLKHNEEVIFCLRDEKYELALVRINDLISQLNQIQESVEISNQNSQINLQEILFELTKIRNKFREKLGDSSVIVNKARFNNKLDIVSDNLNNLIGKTKLFIEKGD